MFFPQSTCVYNVLTLDTALQLLNDANIHGIHDRRELLTSLMALKGPLPIDHAVRESQYFVSYQDRIDEAYMRYRSNIASIIGTIQDIEQEALHNKVTYTTKMKKVDKQSLLHQYNMFLEQDLYVAESYRNELYNYADAALMEWIKYGVEFEVI